MITKQDGKSSSSLKVTKLTGEEKEITESTDEMEKNTQAFEYSGDKIIYLGEAAPGSAKSAAAWAIKKFIYSGNDVIDILWANGQNTKTFIWDNRASYTYS